MAALIGGKERAAMYPQRGCRLGGSDRAIKKDGAPLPSLSSGPPLWLDRGQPATHPCAWTQYESLRGGEQAALMTGL